MNQQKDGFPLGSEFENFNFNCYNFSTKQPMSLIPTASSLVASSPPNLKPYLQLMRVDKPIGNLLLHRREVLGVLRRKYDT